MIYIFTLSLLISSVLSFGQNSRTYRLTEYPLYIPYGQKVIYQDSKQWKIINADSATFRTVSKYSMPIGVDKNGMYIDGIFIPAETTDFEIIYAPRYYDKEPVYWKNRYHVYKNDTLLEGRDPKTFKFVKYVSDYTKDKNGIYYKSTKLDVNTATFNQNDYYFFDKDYVYENGKKLLIDGELIHPGNDVLIFSDSKVYNISKMLLPNIDAKSLTILSRSFSYDKNNVYYGIKPIAKTPPDPSKIRFYDWINKRYIVIGNRVFWGDHEVSKKDGYDAPSFGVYPQSDIVMYDKKGAFYHKYNDRTNNVDKKYYPFKYIYPFNPDDIKITEGRILIYKDREFYDLHNGDYGKLLKNLTEKEKDKLRTGSYFGNISDSIISIDRLFYRKDGKIHFSGYPQPVLTGIDHDSFENLGFPYCKDKNGIYLLTDRRENIMKAELMAEVDSESFKVLINDYTYDKYHVYNNGTILDKISADKIQLIAVFIGYRMGCSLDTSRPFDYYLYSNIDGYWLLSPHSQEFIGTEFPKEMFENPVTL